MAQPGCPEVNDHHFVPIFHGNSPLRLEKENQDIRRESWRTSGKSRYSQQRGKQETISSSGSLYKLTILFVTTGLDPQKLSKRNKGTHGETKDATPTTKAELM
jgi:hypothetical protein